MNTADNIILGIDLGTTNSLVAHYTAGGPELLADDAGDVLIPSVIAFADGKVTVGSAAKANAVLHPLSTVYSVKRLMGRSIADVREDLGFLPYEVVAGARVVCGREIGIVSWLDCSLYRNSSVSGS